MLESSKIRESLSVEDIYTLLKDFGGNPLIVKTGIICDTIDHNLPGEGSKKLYYYNNSKLFISYTSGADYFDIFELIIKVAKIQWNQDYSLYQAINYVISFFNLNINEYKNIEDINKEWKILNKYDEINNITVEDKKIEFNYYDKKILNNFNYKVKILPWLEEGISQEAMDLAQISYYPGSEQIIIPHFDKDNHLIGIRGRTLVQEEEKYGKYRPVIINKKQYNHPLSYNCYGLNWAKDNIKKFKIAIVAESEKSVLRYMSLYGIDNNICVACCGSNITSIQIKQLIECGAEEVCIAFDRDWEQVNDSTYIKQKNNLIRLNNKFKNYVKISLIWDKNKITKLKSSPLDEDKFMKLFKERIMLCNIN